MHPVKRFWSSFRRGIPLDASFEHYYGTIARNQPEGGPTAREARRDFMAIRSHLDRSLIF